MAIEVKSFVFKPPKGSEMPRMATPEELESIQEDRIRRAIAFGKPHVVIFRIDSRGFSYLPREVLPDGTVTRESVYATSETMQEASLRAMAKFSLNLESYEDSEREAADGTVEKIRRHPTHHQGLDFLFMRITEHIHAGDPSGLEWIVSA